METVDVSKLATSLVNGNKADFTVESFKLYSSLRERGYCHVATSALNASALNAVLSDAHAKFDDPHNAQQVNNPTDADRGYFKATASSPEHFVLAVDDPLPSISSSLSDARAILETLGYRLDPNFQTIFSDLLDHKIPPPGAKASSLLKLVKYTGSGEALSLPEHIDRGLISILVSDADGLEVWDSVDEGWVGIAANSPVLLIGHTLEAASGGAFKATRHRVKTKKPRLSVALFIRGRGDAIFKPQKVPKGKRTSEGMGLVDGEGMKVKELMANFAESHKSVTGKAAGGSSSSAKRGSSSSNSESDNAGVKRARVPSDRFIHLRVREIEGRDRVYKTRGTIRLGKVFDAWFTEMRGFSLENCKFIFHGKLLRSEDTPDSFEMGDDDIIHVCKSMPGD
jgi:hypothetical protein